MHTWFFPAPQKKSAFCAVAKRGTAKIIAQPNTAIFHTGIAPRLFSLLQLHYCVNLVEAKVTLEAVRTGADAAAGAPGHRPPAPLVSPIAAGLTIRQRVS